MKIIEKLVDMIDDELEGAEHYIECAIKYKDEFPTLASAFYEISLQEMHHVNILHEQVAGIIKKHREKHGEPPATMLAIWDWQHEKNIETVKEIKVLQEYYHSAK